MKKILLFLITFIVAIPAMSQENIIDTRGREFWLAFPPNYHNYATVSDLRLKYGDSLMIYITAERTASGSITYHDVYGNQFVENFNIANPNEIYNFKVSYYDFEIPGYYSIRRFPSNNQTLDYNETPTKMAFHIEADDDIRVYANSQAKTTSEAMLIYPIKSLGTEYMVMSYYSDPIINNGFIDRYSSTPSQFVIIATENETTVEIIPSGKTLKNGLSTHSIELQKGESYLVQADLRLDENIDLTGTEVKSDKPIAVIGSHQRAKVPQYESIGTSRDILLEQLPPLKVWGTNAFIVPFPDMPTHPNIQNDDDFFRILAYYDNTIVNFNGQFDITLNKGEFFEEAINEEYNINSDKPILVATFKKSSTTQGDLFDGDPFMMIIPTAELYLNDYTFFSVQAYELIQTGISSRYVKVYNNQYVTIIIQEQFVNSLVLDGQSINPNLFKTIPQTDYVYAHIEDIGDGTHNISAAANFGIYIFGIGPANSYGYVGGMNLNPIDHTPPEYSSSIICNKINGKVTEFAEIDSKVSEVNIIDEQNVNLSIGDFNKYAEEVSFEASLIDIYQDGFFKIESIDSIGLKSQFETEIPGFTVSVLLEDNTLGIEEIKDSIPIIRTNCYEARITNYGKFPQNITSISLLNNSSDISTNPSAFTLLPGETRSIEICLSPNNPGLTIDTVMMNDDCFSRIAATIEIYSVKDPFPPGFSFISDECNQTFEYDIFDNRTGDYGLREIKIENRENCNILIPENLNSEITKVIISVLDPYQDARFRLVAIDSSFSETVIEEVIPGFTLVYSFLESGNSAIYEMQNTEIGKLNCERIIINNYGDYPLEIDDIFFTSNTQFTVPTEQLPLLINPSEELELEICFYPNIAAEENYRDTLNLEYNCVGIELPVEAKADSLFRNGNSRCDVELFMSSGKISYGYSVSEVFPNPAQNSVSIILSTEKNRNIEISLVNSNGKLLLDEIHKLPEEGIYKITVDLKEINSGAYYLLFKSGNMLETKPLIIEK